MWDFLDYTFADFLLFSPEVYFRLFELYNKDIWPAQLASPVFAVAIIFLARHGARHQSRVISLGFAAMWLWVGYAYYAVRYATINDWAVVLAWIAALQAILFLVSAVRHTPVRYQTDRSIAGVAGAVLVALAAFLYPFLTFAVGRNWRGAEIFGFAPDPTMVATFGLVLLSMSKSRWILIPLPLLLAVVSGMTAVAMEAYSGLFTCLAGAIAIVLMMTRKHRPLDIN